MATRFCGHCGTEVDDDAAFCPSCGRPIAAYDADDQTAAIPPAPAWPTPAPAADAAPGGSAEPAAADERGGWDPEPSSSPVSEEPTAAGAQSEPYQAAAYQAPAGAPPTDPPPAEEPPPAYEPPAHEPPAYEPPARRSAPPPAAPPPAGMPPPAAAMPDRSSGPQVELPITWPVTMSGWLIGGGTFVAGIGFVADMFAFRGAGNAMNVIFLLLMLGIAATVFLSATVPAIPHLRLATLCIVFVALGVALDRLGFSVAGFGTLLVLLGTAAAAAGAVILELGRDQPMAGPMDRR